MHLHASVCIEYSLNTPALEALREPVLSRKCGSRPHGLPAERQDSSYTSPVGQIIRQSAISPAQLARSTSINDTHTITHTLTHSHTMLISCACCYDLTKGTQDKDFSYSFSILCLSMSLLHPFGSQWARQMWYSVTGCTRTYLCILCIPWLLCLISLFASGRSSTGLTWLTCPESEWSSRRKWKQFRRKCHRDQLTSSQSQ
jgi:hypothetical protein